MADLLVVALGGNALLPASSSMSYEAQLERIRRTAGLLADLIQREGARLVLTHGNGPQVGLQLLRYEHAKHIAEPYPLYVAVAETQAQIGFALRLALEQELRKRGIEREVVPLLSLVSVKEDQALSRPTKPVGPYYSDKEAEKLRAEHGWAFIEERGMYRRVVPSPEPVEVLEAPLVAELLKQDMVVVCCGGGGIPVLRRDGQLVPVEGVVDKDLASERLASALHAKALIMLTDVRACYLNFGRRGQRALRSVSPGQLKKYYEQGHFPEGSMGPKVRAAIRFVEAGGRMAVIAHLEDLLPAARGEAGTVVRQGP